jgi:hypothetical protein
MARKFLRRLSQKMGFRNPEPLRPVVMPELQAPVQETEEQILRRLHDRIPASFHFTKTIYIHIPKTCGISICKALYGHQVGHSPMSEYGLSAPDAVKSYFKFAVCRDPMDRAFSAFRYVKNGGLTPEDRRWARAHIPPSMTFGEFVTDVLVCKKFPAPHHFNEQHKYVEKYPYGPMGIDYVIRFEQIQAAIPMLESVFKRPIQLPTLNVGKPATELDGDCNDSTVRTAVFEIYERDYWLFSYPAPI